MGVVLVYLLYLASLIVPPVLIFDAPSPSGRKKAIWMAVCVVSVFVPSLISAFGMALQPSVQSMMFGPWAYIAGLLNTVSIVAPWAVYASFKARYRKDQPQFSGEAASRPLEEQPKT